MVATERKNNAKPVVFGIAVFAFLLFFFAVLYPMPVMNADDFQYITDMRPAIPSPTLWNPTRVLPEILMPICGNLAGALTALGLGTFIECQVFVVALALSLFITLYVMVFEWLLEKRFDVSRFEAVLISVIFLILHVCIA